MSLKVSIPVNIGVEPYPIAGTGAYFVHDHIDVSNYYHHALSDNDTTFGVNVGGGIHFNIRPNFFVGAACEYVWLDPSLLRSECKLKWSQDYREFWYQVLV
jgi:opacity protein-like surface antigen